MNTKYVKPENYIVIQGFMLTDLHLKGTALLVYAIIYGFSQLDGQRFNASLRYLEEFTGSTKPSVINALKQLVDKGYITKSNVSTGGVPRVEYRAVDISPKINSKTNGKETLPDCKETLPDCKETLPEVVKKLYSGGKETLPNNIIYNINNNLNDNIKEKYKRESAQQNTPETPKKPTRHKYGTYKNVFLTDEDMEKLKSEFPDDWRNRIERLSDYIASSGKTYKNHLATIRVWAKKDKERETLKNGAKNIKWCMDKESISLDEIYGLEVAK